MFIERRRNSQRQQLWFGFLLQVQNIFHLDFLHKDVDPWIELATVSPANRAMLVADLLTGKMSSGSKLLIDYLYDLAVRRHHLHMIKVSGIFSLLTFDIFVFGDGYIAPDMFWISIFVRFGIVTPLGILCIYHADRYPKLVDQLTTLVFIIAELLLLSFMIWSSSPESWIFGFGIAAVCAGANLFQSFPFKQAIVVTAASLATCIIGLELSPSVSAASGLYLYSMTVMFCLFSLFSNYRLDREQRRQYVVGLTEKLKADALSDQNRELIQTSEIDALTQIYNRRYFDQKLAEYHAHHLNNQLPLGILVIDVDHFKQFNDLNGHAAGDMCLQRVAQALSQGVRTSLDIVARYGGEEFVILLPETTLHEAHLVGERLRRKVEGLPMVAELAGAASPLTVSIGCHAAVPVRRDETDRFFAAADAAVYQAKSAGRNRVSLSRFAGHGATGLAG